jgi:hypothetical protein
MAVNDFNKEERVAFEKILMGFEDDMSLSHAIHVLDVDQVMMERTGDTMWRPEPYIMPIYSGVDMTNNFGQVTQLSVPTQIGYEYSVPWTMTHLELRDALQNDRLGQSARQRLSSQFNLSCMEVARDFGTVVSVKSGAASGYADVSSMEAMFNRMGIPHDDRYIHYCTQDYNGMAADLANRDNMTEISSKAYRKSYVGEVANFKLLRGDYGLSLPAGTATGLTIDTRTAAGNYYVPRATQTVNNIRGNVDNRFDTITLSANTNLAVGNVITIAGITEVHHINKESTGELKTFRVTNVDANGTDITICPPIMSAQGGSIGEVQYQNCSVAASATAAVTVTNTVRKPFNPAWHKNAIEITPGRHARVENAGVPTLRSSTSQGIEISFRKWEDIKTLVTLYRMDIRYGVTAVQPEMMGGQIFGQT